MHSGAPTTNIMDALLQIRDNQERVREEADAGGERCVYEEDGVATKSFCVNSILISGYEY